MNVEKNMIRSMTGYGQSEAVCGGRSAAVEIKSVNHRYCEISVRIPGRYSFVEEDIRKYVKNRAARGKIDVLISFTSANEEDALVTLNTAVAKQYFAGLRELQKTFDTTGDISIDLLASLPDVLRQERPQTDETAIRALLLEATESAFDAFDQMRIAEGSELQADLEKRLNSLVNIANSIGKRAPEVREHHMARLRERIAEIADMPADEALIEQRLALEIAIFADKSSIDEELVRLASHIEQFKTTIIDNKANGPVGKKLDFIIQEMNREANTIGSKANDIRITDLMIELKNEIENIREQVQNIA